MSQPLSVKDSNANGMHGRSGYPLAGVVQVIGGTSNERTGSQPAIPANLPLVVGYSSAPLPSLDKDNSRMIGSHHQQTHPSYIGRGPINSDKHNDDLKITQAIWSGIGPSLTQRKMEIGIVSEEGNPEWVLHPSQMSEKEEECSTLSAKLKNLELELTEANAQISSLKEELEKRERVEVLEVQSAIPDVGKLPGSAHYKSEHQQMQLELATMYIHVGICHAVRTLYPHMREEDRHLFTLVRDTNFLHPLSRAGADYVPFQKFELEMIKIYDSKFDLPPWTPPPCLPVNYWNQVTATGDEGPDAQSKEACTGDEGRDAPSKRARTGNERADAPSKGARTGDEGAADAPF